MLLELGHSLALFPHLDFCLTLGSKERGLQNRRDLIQVPALRAAMPTAARGKTGITAASFPGCREDRCLRNYEVFGSVCNCWLQPLSLFYLVSLRASNCIYGRYRSKISHPARLLGPRFQRVMSFTICGSPHMNRTVIQNYKNPTACSWPLLLTSVLLACILFLIFYCLHYT